MKKALLVAAVFVVGALAGILLEHYVGTAAIIDWSGLRHAAFVRELRSTAGRTEIPRETLPGKRTMVVLAFGQSNAANGGETPGIGHPATYEFYNSRLYAARDPLLGTDGDGGSVWLRLAAKAVESAEFDAVVLVTMAFSTTEIARWAPGGTLHDALIARIEKAQAAGLRFTHLLWHQGEADARLKTDEAAYRASFLAMLAAIRKAGADAPVHVAVATRCGKVRGHEPVRKAQIGLRDPAAGIFGGPDTDQLGFGERYDGCHFSREGMERAAGLWWEAIRSRPGR
jgi:hypothetical protein